MPAVQEWFWGVLGIQPPVSVEGVQTAFKRRAILMHPDHGGSSNGMSALNLAREEALCFLKRPLHDIIQDANDSGDPYDDVTVYTSSVIEEREMAVRYQVTGGKLVWIPRSQIRASSVNTFTIPRWLAEDRGLV